MTINQSFTNGVHAPRMELSPAPAKSLEPTSLEFGLLAAIICLLVISVTTDTGLYLRSQLRQMSFAGARRTPADAVRSGR